MRDLEIRGAGNLLGTAQSGHITAVGFDLYCQLLKTAVARMKGQKTTRLIDTRLDLDFIAWQENEVDEKAGRWTVTTQTGKPVAPRWLPPHRRVAR